MNDTTYNGWTNYPTWAVNLWLGNDEGLYNATTELVADILKDEPNDEPLQQHTLSVVANSLKTWVCNDLAPDLGASFAADLLGYALDCVDWTEIADAWIESVREYAA